MADTKSKGDDKAQKERDLRTKKVLLQADGKKPIGYCFGLGASPDECQLLVHKTLAGKKLIGEIENPKELKKIGWGSVAVAGKEATFYEEKPIPNFDKILARMLKAKKIPLQPKTGVGKVPPEGKK